jgi:hypothetical protein
MEIWEPKPPGNLWATPGLLWDSSLYHSSDWWKMQIYCTEIYRQKYVGNVCDTGTQMCRGAKILGANPGE